MRPSEILNLSIKTSVPKVFSRFSTGRISYGPTSLLLNMKISTLEMIVKLPKYLMLGEASSEVTNNKVYLQLVQHINSLTKAHYLI